MLYIKTISDAADSRDLKLYSEYPPKNLWLNQTLLIIVQNRKSEKSRSVPSSDYFDQSMLYIKTIYDAADSRDLNLYSEYPPKNLGSTKPYL